MVSPTKEVHMEFIFSPDEDIVRNPNDYMGSYGFDAYEELSTSSPWWARRS